MRRAILLAATVLATVTVGACPGSGKLPCPRPASAAFRRASAELARFRQRGRALLVRNPASAYGQTVSYLSSPPYINMADRFGGLGNSTLPDPVTNGPFVGAQNILGPVDYNGFYGYSVHDR